MGENTFDHNRNGKTHLLKMVNKNPVLKAKLFELNCVITDEATVLMKRV